jgi:hypothetical protein
MDTADIERRLRAIEDRQEIYDVMMRYALGLDTSDPELYASVFTEDAYLNVAGIEYRGHKTIKDMIAGFRARADFSKRVPDPHGLIFGPVRHVVTNLSMSIKGDTATAESYSVEIASGGRNEKGQGQFQKIINVCRYQDDLTKRTGKWLIAKRLIIGDLYGKLPPLDMNIWPHTAAPSALSP